MDKKETDDMIFCQSCGMPLEKKEDFGTNADGSQNWTYCKYCYRDGSFTKPDITMEEMIDLASGTMADMEIMSLEEARAMNEKFIPRLKRWKK